MERKAALISYMDNKNSLNNGLWEALDKISEAMDSLDFDGLSDSIQSSVDLIRKEAEAGFQNFKNASENRQQLNEHRSGNSQAHRSSSGKYSPDGTGYVYQDGTYHTQTEKLYGQNYAYGNGQGYYSTRKNDPRKNGTVTNQNGGRPSVGQRLRQLPVIRKIPGTFLAPMEIAFGGVWSVATTICSAAMMAAELQPFLLVTVPLMIGSYAMVAHGIHSQKRVNRLNSYNRYLKGKNYCMVEDLAKGTGRPLKVVKKDVNYILSHDLIPDLSLDKQGTCLIFTPEAKEQYEQAEYARLNRELEEAKAKAAKEAEELKKTLMSQEEKDWLAFEESYQNFYADLGEIRKEMDTPVMKQHVEDIDLLLKRIFECIRDHKEMIGSTGHLTSYYFPCMSKLFHTYLDLEEQPIQGDNILKTKGEIETSFDTIEKALTNMYDDLFQYISMDISSDIQVLNTMMSQDGWKEQAMHAESSPFSSAGFGGSAMAVAEEEQ